MGHTEQWRDDRNGNDIREVILCEAVCLVGGGDGMRMLKSRGGVTE